MVLSDCSEEQRPGSFDKDFYGNSSEKGENFSSTGRGGSKMLLKKGSDYKAFRRNKRAHIRMYTAIFFLEPDR